MTWLTRFAIRHARLTLVLVLLAVFGGVHTYLNQPSQEDPEITIRVAVITAGFPGMSAHRIEQLLTKPIEEAVRQVPEIERIESASETGVATVKVELGAQYGDVKRIWADLRNKIDDLAPQLPQGTIGPDVNDDYGRVAVTTVALTGSDFTLAELRAQARWLRDRLAALPLVSRVDLHGIQDERIWLEFDRARLAQLGLTPQAVLGPVAEQNRILPAGALYTEDGLRYGIEPSGAFADEAAIGNVPISTPTGAIIQVRDVLTIRRGYIDPLRKPVYFKGRPAVVLAVSMVSTANIADFGRGIERRLATLTTDLPAGMSLDLVTHQPPIVRQSLDEASANLVQTVTTVLVVVMLFLGLRAGAIVGAIVPLAILLALVGMQLWEVPLHRISIAAIIISLGLLVDNGVVMAEDIKKRIDGGMERLDAALAASASLGIPLLTSSLTTILAFLPLMLAEDATGEFLRALSQVILITLLASWLLAVTITPLLSYRFMPAQSSKGAIAGADRVRLYYGHLLAGVLRTRYAFVGAMVVLLIMAGLAMRELPTGLLPPSERAQFIVNLELPAGTSEARTAEVTQHLAGYLSDSRVNPEVTGNVFYVGYGGPRFFLALSPLDPAPHVAFGVVNTRSADDVAALRARVDRFMSEQAYEARGWTEVLFLGSEPPGTLQIRLRGADANELYRLSRSVEELFQAIPGTRHIRGDWSNPVLQIDVAIDQERARRAGLQPAQVANGLEATFGGVTITELREGDKLVPIVLRAQFEDRQSLDRLAETVVVNQDGAAVPLLQVAAIQGASLPYVIRRFDQERAVTISAINPGMPAAQLLAEMRPGLDALDLPPGYSWEPDGEVTAAREANAALFAYMPHCLMGILVLLIWQFNSLRRPAIILLTIPLVLIGTVLGLHVMGGIFDFNAMLGVVSLAGIIINNGIVLIDQIDAERRKGKATRPAVIAASQSRLRPILMTTLTTIVGLLPLHLFGGPLWYSMTVVMMFGLGIGTILTLGVVPALYAIMFPDRAAARAQA
jgi:multidrug efflux pump subunit AcrB